MKLGCVPEGATDRAVLHALRDRWCPSATMEEIAYRGSRCRHRDYPKVCAEAQLKGIDVLVVLTDANGRKWHEVRKAEQAALPDNVPLELLVGVCDRNVECWICADADYVAAAANCDSAAFRVPDPKGVLQRALGVTKYSTQEERIREIVAKAPLKAWNNASPSFHAFYGDARALSLRLGCAIPDEE